MNAQNLTEANWKEASGWQSFVILEMKVMVIKYPFDAASTWSETGIRFIFPAETRKIQNYFTVVYRNQTSANPCYQPMPLFLSSFESDTATECAEKRDDWRFLIRDIPGVPRFLFRM